MTRPLDRSTGKAFDPDVYNKGGYRCHEGYTLIYKGEADGYMCVKDNDPDDRHAPQIAQAEDVATGAPAFTPQQDVIFAQEAVGVGIIAVEEGRIALALATEQERQRLEAVVAAQTAEAEAAARAATAAEQARIDAAAEAARQKAAEEAKARAEQEAALRDPRFIPSFNDQCFLLEKAKDIYAALSGSIPIKEDSPIRQLGIKPLEGYKTNLQYINDITSLINTKNFFEITPEETAQLAHYATITEVVRRNSDVIQKTPIFSGQSLSDFTNDDYVPGDAHELSMFRSQGRRSGAGIKSINVDFEGIDSATDKIVLLNAQFLFQDIREMLSQPYIELFLIKTKKEINTGEQTTEGFRTIDFEIGWKSNPTITSRLKLENLKLKLRTHIVKYTFDLKQDGSILVNAQYRGHIVDVLNGSSSNILELAKNTFSLVKNNLQELEQAAQTNRQNAARAQKDAAYRKLATFVVRKVFENQGILTQLGNLPADAPIEDYNKLLMDARDASVGHIRTLSTANQIHGGEFSTAEKNVLQGHIEETIERIKLQTREFVRTLGGGVPPELQGGTITSGPGGAAGGLGGQAVVNATKIVDLTSQLLRDPTEQASAAAGSLIASAESQRLNAIRDAAASQLREAQLAKYIALQVIGRKLIERDIIQYAIIERVKVSNFKIAVAQMAPEKVATVMNSIIPTGFLKSLTNAMITETQLNEETHQVIPFVFLGELLQAVIELPTNTSPTGELTGMVYELIEQETGEKPKIDFGYVSYRSPYTGTPNNDFKLYYLPISLKKINDFFAREVVGKELEFLSFNDFLLKVFRKFLTTIFSVCTREAKQSGFHSPKIQTVVGGTDKQMNYFLYGSKNVINDIRRGEIEFGKYLSNLENKIYHFYLGGQSKGAIKNVKVIDIADSATKTAVYYQNRVSNRSNTEGDLSSRGGLPPVVFQTEIETIGFPLFNMGQLIYVDLRPYVVENNIRHFKANGYYGVTKVSHTFSEAAFSSKVSAILQFSKADEGNGELAAGVESSGTPAPTAESFSQEGKEALSQVDQQLELDLAEVKWIEDYVTLATQDVENVKLAIGQGHQIEGLAQYPGAGTPEEIADTLKIAAAEAQYEGFKQKLLDPPTSVADPTLKSRIEEISDRINAQVDARQAAGQPISREDILKQLFYCNDTTGAAQILPWARNYSDLDCGGNQQQQQQPASEQENTDTETLESKESATSGLVHME